jgi:hypothetical protein
MEEQLPHKVEGAKMATHYLWRQHWRMKWMTALIAGPMAAYSINAHAWIPYLKFSFTAWTLLMFASIMCQMSMNKMFAIHVNDKRKGKDPDPAVMKEITQHALIHWGVSLMIWYWVGVLLFANDLIQSS